MKTLCPSCNKTKGKRYCPALDAMICPVCCATKRQKEIACPSDCTYLISGSNYIATRGISQEISNTFKREADDIFKNYSVVLELAAPLERFLGLTYFPVSSVKDEDIYNILSKIYLKSSNQSPQIITENVFEKQVVEEYYEIFNRSDLSDDIKSKTVLRILMSIKQLSGGAFGNRNYLRFIYNQQFSN